MIVLAAYTIVLFFTCPETTFNRAAKLDTDVLEVLDDSTDDGSSAEIEQTRTTLQPKQLNVPQNSAIELEKGPVDRRDQYTETKQTYLQSLRVYNGRFSGESMWKAFVTPWSAFLLPAVSWTAYAYGCSVAFSASFSVALAQVFTKSPYFFTTAQVGLTVLSAFIGATLGNIIPGPLCDWLAKYMSRKNRGIYEPEFRIVLTVPAFFLGLMGFWGFGMSLHAKSHWMAPVFFFGLATFAGSIQSLISNAYLLDCHRAHAQDGYAAVTIGRGIMSFVMTLVINDWIKKDGIRNVYLWVGTLHGISCLIGMYLYIYGKRVSSWTARMVQ